MNDVIHEQYLKFQKGVNDLLQYILIKKDVIDKKLTLSELKENDEIRKSIVERLMIRQYSSPPINKVGETVTKEYLLDGEPILLISEEYTKDDEILFHATIPPTEYVSKRDRLKGNNE